MTAPDAESLPALPRLADALTEVSGRLRDIGAELRVLQLAAPSAAAAPPAPPLPNFSPPPAPNPLPYPPAHPPQYPSSFPPFGMPPPPTGPFPTPGAAPWRPVGPPPRPPRRPGPTLWERISREGAGSRLLAWVGGGVTLAGIVLLLVLAVQRGYLAPLPRVLVGASLAALLVGTGLFLHRNPAGRIGARAVAATGVAGLYLDVIAATSVYSYLPVAAGLLVGLAVAAGGVAIAARWDSELFAVFVVACCAISAPILTSGFDSVLVGFVLVLLIATTPVQVTKRWSGLGLAAGIPPVVATLATVTQIGAGSAGDATTVALIATLSAVVQIGVATAVAERGSGQELALGILLAAPVPALLGAVFAPHLPAAVLLAALATLLGTVWTLHRLRLLAVPEPFARCAAAAGAIAGFVALGVGFDGSARAGALLAGGLLIAVLARQLREQYFLVAAAAFAGVGALLALGGAVRPRLLAVAPTDAVPVRAVVTAGSTGVLLALTAIVLAWVASRLITAGPDLERLVWATCGTAALYGGSAALLSVGLAIDPGERGFLVGHVLVTVSWTLAALVLLLRHVDSTPLRVAGLCLVAAALAKLVVFDLSSLSGIPRVLAFLGAGLVLLAAGARYAKLVTTAARAE